MVAQTTDSGGNNRPMATELEAMFASSEDVANWDSSTHHVRCYAPKLNLVVGHGLKAIGQNVGNAKPSTPYGFALPIPGLEVNDGEDAIEYNESDSESEDENGLPDYPDGVDNEDEHEYRRRDVIGCDKDDVVAVALAKVSTIQ